MTHTPAPETAPASGLDVVDLVVVGVGLLILARNLCTISEALDRIADTVAPRPETCGICGARH